MKSLKSIVLGFCIVIAGAVILQAVDSTYNLSYYLTQGRSAGYVVNEGLTSVFDADNLQGIDTTNRYQLQRKAITVPIEMTSAGADTFDYTILVVPPGLSYTLESMQLTAAVEATGSGVCRGQVLYYKWQGDTLMALDTLVAKMELDADSAIVYADTVYSLTLTDTSLEGGELVFWRAFNSGASTIEGPAVSILYRQDE